MRFLLEFKEFGNLYITKDWDKLGDIKVLNAVALNDFYTAFWTKNQLSQKQITEHNIISPERYDGILARFRLTRDTINRYSNPSQELAFSYRDKPSYKGRKDKMNNDEDMPEYRNRKGKHK